jgi:hypothetical protein
MLFKKLNRDELKAYERWAHENYTPNTLPEIIWHPAVRYHWYRIAMSEAMNELMEVQANGPEK